jgi:hypothetical protein
MLIFKQILNYKGPNKFMNSLRRQLTVKGTLSNKQVAAAESFFNVAKVKAEVAPRFTYKKGDEITVRKGFAQGKAKKLNLQYFFRNLIIDEVLCETPKAVHVKVRFNDKVTTCCHMCGLGLDTEISKATGVGPVCAKKLGFKRVSMADAGAILAKVTEEARNAGIIELWLPKSQIVSKAEQVLFKKE